MYTLPAYLPRISLYVSFFLILFIGCDGDNLGPLDICNIDYPIASSIMKDAPVVTVLFSDVSASAGSVSEQTVEEQQRLIAYLFRDGSLNRNSVINAYAVHAMTRGGAEAIRYSQKVDLPTQGVNSLETKRSCERYVRQVQERAEQSYNEILTLLGRAMPRHLSTGTDLWGALQRASEDFAQTPVDVRKRIVLITDGFQCTRETRCFDIQPPTTQEQARVWALEDARRLSEHVEIVPGTLSGAEVVFFRRELANKPGSRYVDTYWRTLLNELGISPPSVSFE